MNKDPLVPIQEEGASSETIATRKVTIQEASALFEKAKSRIKAIHEWRNYAGTGSAEFLLTNNAGEPVERDPEKDDYFRINIPGPGNDAGEGYDWVKLIEVKEADGNERFYSITVRPAPAPVNNNTDVAHFFSESATSTFIVKLIGTELSVEIAGRNEKPNTSVEKDSNKLRNAAIATGAVTIFSKIQWKKLVNGILDF